MKVKYLVVGLVPALIATCTADQPAQTVETSPSAVNQVERPFPRVSLWRAGTGSSMSALAAEFSRGIAPPVTGRRRDFPVPTSAVARRLAA